MTAFLPGIGEKQMHPRQTVIGNFLFQNFDGVMMINSDIVDAVLFKQH